MQVTKQVFGKKFVSVQGVFAILLSAVLLVTVWRFLRSSFKLHLKVDQKDMKYILIWHSHDFSPFYFLGEGTQQFVEKKCPVNHCYTTTNRKLFDEVSEFDVVAFNGRTLHSLNELDLPQKRSAKQKYVYMNLESNINTPLGPKWVDNFFNWTSTYRLSSDIPLTYLQVKNKKGEVVGPKPNVKWIKEMNTPAHVMRRLRKKTKAVAWFVSNCNFSQRFRSYVELQKALTWYGLEIDVYGACGKHSCGRDREIMCDQMLDNDYHFYLAYENSFASDYVTEKLLRAMLYNVVPIVYGGADYSRFLPPQSYIDARNTTTKEIASIIFRSLHSMKLYQRFFKWKSHYDYSNPIDVDVTSNICAICAAIHNTTLMETTTVYKDMRSWWNSN